MILLNFRQLIVLSEEISFLSSDGNGPLHLPSLNTRAVHYHKYVQYLYTHNKVPILKDKASKL